MDQQQVRGDCAGGGRERFIPKCVRVRKIVQRGENGNREKADSESRVVRRQNAPRPPPEELTGSAGKPARPDDRQHQAVSRKHDKNIHGAAAQIQPVGEMGRKRG